MGHLGGLAYTCGCHMSDNFLKGANPEGIDSWGDDNFLVSASTLAGDKDGDLKPKSIDVTDGSGVDEVLDESDLDLLTTSVMV